MTICADGFICPHCAAKYPLIVAEGLDLHEREVAVLTCQACYELFTVKAQETPAGKTWVTETNV